MKSECARDATIETRDCSGSGSTKLVINCYNFTMREGRDAPEELALEAAERDIVQLQTDQLRGPRVK
jgi:hypothetical protein